MILVSDTSVLIDLERGGVLEATFSLPYEFAVPDVLYDHEMQGDWGVWLVRLGLRVEEVSKEGVANALRYRRQRASLSVPDSFALDFGEGAPVVPVDGDGQLRDLASEEDVECHGVLWLLDMTEQAGTLAIQSLHDGLTALAAHPRCRLPRREITIRLERYQIILGNA